MMYLLSFLHYPGALLKWDYLKIVELFVIVPLIYSPSIFYIRRIQQFDWH